MPRLSTISRHRWLTLIEASLAILVAVQLGRIVWLALAPLLATPPALPAPRYTAPLDTPVLAAHAGHFDLPGAPADAASDANGWRLFGLRTGPDGGSAILAEGSGPQRTFGVGEEIAPGLHLQTVAANHAVLRQGATTRTLSLPEPEAVAAAVPASPATTSAPAPTGPAPSAQPATAADVDPGQLMAQAGLRLTREAGRIAGYTLMPRGDGRLVRAAGLQPGDVILSVNGETLDPEHLPELLIRLRSDPRAVVTYRRDGQTRTVTLGSGTE